MGRPHSSIFGDHPGERSGGRGVLDDDLEYDRQEDGQDHPHEPPEQALERQPDKHNQRAEARALPVIVGSIRLAVMP